jgi:hypothetical protein
MAMTKASALKIVNPVLAGVAVLQAATAILFTFFSEVIPYGQVRLIHLITGYVLFGIVALHIYLNWTWIKSTFFKKRSKA